MARQYYEIRFEGTDDEIREKWIDRRKHGIGGSDASAILGANKYKSQVSVWLEKTGRVESQDLSNVESVYWGNVLEDVVAKEYAKRHPGYKVSRKNAMMINKKFPFMFASVDRVVTDEKGRKGILEIKTTSLRNEKDWAEDVPDYYFAQPTHYLAVTGYEFFDVAVLIGGQRYVEYHHERDEEDIDTLVSLEAQFWLLVESDTMPIPSNKDGDSVLAMHEDPNGDVEYMLDADIPELDELEEVKRQLDELTKRKDELTNVIKDKVGDRSGIETDRYYVSWPRSKSKKFDSKRFKSEEPETYEKYTTEYTRDCGLRIKVKEQ